MAKNIRLSMRGKKVVLQWDECGTLRTAKKTVAHFDPDSVLYAANLLLAEMERDPCGEKLLAGAKQ